MEELNKAPEVNEEGKEPVKTFTQEEVEKMVQQEADRRVSSARKVWEVNERTKIEEDYQKKVQKEKELAQLSAEERFKKELSDKEKSLKEQERSLNMERMKFQAGQDLVKRGLPTDFLDLIVAETSEKTLENIENYERQWAEAIDKAIEERMKGRTPELKRTDKNSNIEALERKANDMKLPLHERILAENKLRKLKQSEG